MLSMNKCFNNLGCLMYKSLLLVIIALTNVTQLFASDNPFKPFVGRYTLIDVVKETDRNLFTRGALCRDAMKISISKAGGIVLKEENIDRVGMTINWLEPVGENDNITTFKENYVYQNRNHVQNVLGVKRKHNLTTKLTIDGDTLTYHYHYFINSFFNRTKTVDEKICTYSIK